jgi:pimeloyl-ACP methyl ester carboxylesterase
LHLRHARRSARAKLHSVGAADGLRRAASDRHPPPPSPLRAQRRRKAAEAPEGATAAPKAKPLLAVAFPEIAASTLVLSGELDIILPPRFGRSVAAGIPNARFDVMPGDAHQPFQEVPDEFNARVEAFWREVETRG